MAKTHERGITMNIATTSDGRRTFNDTTPLTEVGEMGFGSFEAPWNLEITHDGTLVLIESYQGLPQDLVWIPPEDPPWGNRAGQYDYFWTPG